MEVDRGSRYHGGVVGVFQESWGGGGGGGVGGVLVVGWRAGSGYSLFGRQ